MDGRDPAAGLHGRGGGSATRRWGRHFGVFAALPGARPVAGTVRHATSVAVLARRHDRRPGSAHRPRRWRGVSQRRMAAPPHPDPRRRDVRTDHPAARARGPCPDDPRRGPWSRARRAARCDRGDPQRRLRRRRVLRLVGQRRQRQRGGRRVVRPGRPRRPGCLRRPRPGARSPATAGWLRSAACRGRTGRR